LVDASGCSFGVYFLIACGITDPKQKRAVLLHLAGPEVQDVFTTLQDTGEDYAAALTRLTALFEPKMNATLERHIFRSAAQMPNEPLDAFANRLRNKIPQLRKPGMTKAFTVARRNDLAKKRQKAYAGGRRIKAYSDGRQRAVSSPMKEGDKVLLQQPSRDKLSTRYDPQPYTVVVRKGPSVVLQRGTDPQILRNVFRVR